MCVRLASPAIARQRALLRDLALSFTTACCCDMAARVLRCSWYLVRPILSHSSFRGFCFWLAKRTEQSLSLDVLWLETRTSICSFYTSIDCEVAPQRIRIGPQRISGTCARFADKSGRRSDKKKENPANCCLWRPTWPGRFCRDGSRSLGVLFTCLPFESPRLFMNVINQEGRYSCIYSPFSCYSEDVDETPLAVRSSSSTSFSRTAIIPLKLLPVKRSCGPGVMSFMYSFTPPQSSLRRDPQYKGSWDNCSTLIFAVSLMAPPFGPRGCWTRTQRFFLVFSLLRLITWSKTSVDVFWPKSKFNFNLSLPEEKTIWLWKIQEKSGCMRQASLPEKSQAKPDLHEGTGSVSFPSFLSCAPLFCVCAATSSCRLAVGARDPARISQLWNALCSQCSVSDSGVHAGNANRGRQPSTKQHGAHEQPSDSPGTDCPRSQARDLDSSHPPFECMWWRDILYAQWHDFVNRTAVDRAAADGVKETKTATCSPRGWAVTHPCLRGVFFSLACCGFLPDTLFYVEDRCLRITRTMIHTHTHTHTRHNVKNLHESRHFCNDDDHAIARNCVWIDEREGRKLFLIFLCFFVRKAPESPSCLPTTKMMKNQTQNHNDRSHLCFVCICLPGMVPHSYAYIHTYMVHLTWTHACTPQVPHT